eukprot:scaffold7714_cov133-Isochrysis_galbana.AAC.3
MPLYLEPRASPIVVRRASERLQRGCASSGRMRQDTLLSSGGLASPPFRPFPPLPLPFPPARDLLSQALGGGTGVALGVGWGGVG